MPSNVYVLPNYGKPITLLDEGVYYVLNQHTGAVQTVIQLVYQEDDWLLFELQNKELEGHPTWQVMAEDRCYALNSMNTEQIRYHFNRPQFSEPQGAWQVIKNNQYGFGKFTPLDKDTPIMHAFIMFVNDEIEAVIRLHKVEEEVMVEAGEAEFA